MERLKTISNGDRARPTFSAEERAARLARVRRHMTEQWLDRVLLTSIHNINAFADFVYHAAAGLPRARHRAAGRGRHAEHHRLPLRARTQHRDGAVGAGPRP